MTSQTQQEANPPSSFSITDMRKERNCSEIMIDHNNDTINSSEHVGVLSLHPFYTSTPKSARIICVECRRKPSWMGLDMEELQANGQAAAGRDIGGVSPLYLCADHDKC